jgi:hypothetical protein
MRKLNQEGSSIVAIVAICLLSVAFIGALIFGIWAFSGMSDYKNNSDKKAAAAAAAAVAAEDKKKDAAFAEDYKNPLKTYKGPEAFGAITLQYPKTWSAYILENSSGTPLDAYFNYDFVPAASSQGQYSLRLTLTGSNYDNELKSFQQQVKIGKLKLTPYRLPQLPDVLGVRLEGQIGNQQTVMVMVPIRDKTLKIWTTGTAGLADYDKIILPNLSFTP